MFEINVTALADQTKDYASIIGAILGGFIAAGAGIYLSNYRERKAAKGRQIVVAKALYEQMTSYYDLFELLFEDCTSTKYDEAVKETEAIHKRIQSREEFDNRDQDPIQKFYDTADKRITSLGIATSGKYATFLPELSPFSIFYEDIFKFDDIKEIQNLMQFYKFLAIADTAYKNYCDGAPEGYSTYSLREFLNALEDAYSLMREEPTLDYLKKKASVEKTIWETIRSYNYKRKFKQLLHII